MLLCAGGEIAHVCCDNMPVQAVVPFLYPAKLRLPPPLLIQECFFFKDDRQTRPLPSPLPPPPPLPPPTRYSLPHVLLSVKFPPSSFVPLYFLFIAPSMLPMFRPHQHPGPRPPSPPCDVLLAPAAVAPTERLRFLLHCCLNQTCRVGTHAYVR